MFPLISKPVAGCVHKIKDKNLTTAVLKYKKYTHVEVSNLGVFLYNLIL